MKIIIVSYTDSGKRSKLSKITKLDQHWSHEVPYVYVGILAN